MKIQKLRKTSLMFITAAVFAIGSVFFAAQTSARETTAKDVKEKVADAAQAIKNYSVNQRDEAVKKAKAALDDLVTSMRTTTTSMSWRSNTFPTSSRGDATTSRPTLVRSVSSKSGWNTGGRRSVQGPRPALSPDERSQVQSPETERVVAIFAIGSFDVGPWPFGPGQLS